MNRNLVLPLLAGLLAGCQTMNAADDVPAIITDPDEDSRAALRATVSGLFLGQNVLIADDALTSSSVLPIEFGRRGSLEYKPLSGRVVTEPLRFRLVLNGGDCYLIDPRDESRHLLADTSCTPE